MTFRALVGEGEVKFFKLFLQFRAEGEFVVAISAHVRTVLISQYVKLLVLEYCVRRLKPVSQHWKCLLTNHAIAQTA